MINIPEFSPGVMAAQAIASRETVYTRPVENGAGSAVVALPAPGLAACAPIPYLPACLDAKAFRVKSGQYAWCDGVFYSVARVYKGRACLRRVDPTGRPVYETVYMDCSAITVVRKRAVFDLSHNAYYAASRGQ
jgi:hypothetical protein